MVSLEKDKYKDEDIMVKRPAVFLDRDGVLCAEVGYVTTVEKLEIFPYVKSSVELLHQKGFLAICITNQSAVARGMMEEETLQELNEYLMEKTGLDGLYYCPHHPEGRGRYRIKCNCRKPNIGMLEDAIKEWEIERTKSYMVGDRASDIICGQKAGLKTVLLESGYGTSRLEETVRPDEIYSDLERFAHSIAKCRI